jgi:hypothetical protein
MAALLCWQPCRGQFDRNFLYRLAEQRFFRSGADLTEARSAYLVHLQQLQKQL